MSGTTDWKARAEREAAAILAEFRVSPIERGPINRNTMLTLIAIGWLQGANYADHQRLSDLEDAFDVLRASL